MPLNTELETFRRAGHGGKINPEDRSSWGKDRLMQLCKMLAGDRHMTGGVGRRGGKVTEVWRGEHRTETTYTTHGHTRVGGTGRDGTLA